MRTVLICHADDLLNRDGLARWMASFTTLAGIVVLREPAARATRRWKSELSRVGPIRFMDVVLFRLYYRLVLSARDERWSEDKLAELCRRYPPSDAPELPAASPNAPEVGVFLRQTAPDLVIARCKTLLAERVFSIPRLGTFVMHPGICPEYRNSHGCFWALARRDREHVGMTLLKIDRGVDTGPIYGYFPYTGDDAVESHIVIQHRTVFDHLDGIRQLLERIERGVARPLDVEGRPSGVWGQPWLTAYLRWKRQARAR